MAKGANLVPLERGLLSHYPATLHLVRDDPVWDELLSNPAAVDLIEANVEKFRDWKRIINNPAARHLIPKFFDRYNASLSAGDRFYRTYIQRFPEIICPDTSDF